MADRGKTCNPVNEFKSDQRGSIAVVFAMMSVIMLGVVGGAVDYGRWLSARSKTHNAIDAAVLAGGRVLQLAGMGATEAKAAADKYYSRNKSSALDVDNTVFSVNNTEISGVTTSSVKTPFLSLMGINTLPVNITAKAIVAAGGSGGSHVEVAMMLDTTGSMGGSKMVDLKAAAKDLVDIVVWADQSEYTSRVALGAVLRVRQCWYRLLQRDHQHDCIGWHQPAHVREGAQLLQAVQGRQAAGWSLFRSLYRQRNLQAVRDHHAADQQ